MPESLALPTKGMQSPLISVSGRRMDAGLLLLRGAGLLLALTFGRQKVVSYIELIRGGQPLASSGLAPLIRAMGLPAPGFLGVCAVLNESVGAFCIACGFLTRFSAAVAAFGMVVAFYVSLRLDEEPLRAALYLIVFTGLVLAGPGRYSIDHLLARRQETKNNYRKGVSPKL